MNKIKNILFMLTIFVLTTSCNSQIDIEKITYGSNISDILKDFKEKEKDTDATTSLPSVAITNLNKIRYGSVDFSKYEVDDGYSSDYNRIDFLTEEDKYIGVSFHLVKESEGIKLFEYLKKENGEPSMKSIDEANNSGYYLWNRENSDKLIFYRHSQGSRKDGKLTFYDTHCTIVKKGIILKPDPSNDPETVRQILEENPNAFTLLEVFKSVFPQE